MMGALHDVRTAHEELRKAQRDQQQWEECNMPGKTMADFFAISFETKEFQELQKDLRTAFDTGGEGAMVACAKAWVEKVEKAG